MPASSWSGGRHRQLPCFLVVFPLLRAFTCVCRGDAKKRMSSVRLLRMMVMLVLMAILIVLVVVVVVVVVLVVVVVRWRWRMRWRWWRWRP